MLTAALFYRIITQCFEDDIRELTEP